MADAPRLILANALQFVGRPKGEAAGFCRSLGLRNLIRYQSTARRGVQCY